MKTYGKWAIAAAVMLVGVSPSIAKTINVKARAGAKTQVYSYVVYNPSTCGVMAAPKVSFRQPKHGTFTSKRFSARISKGKRCAGKLMKGVAVYYRAKAGFRGADKGTVGFTTPRFVDDSGTSYFRLNVNLQVR